MEGLLHLLSLDEPLVDYLVDCRLDGGSGANSLLAAPFSSSIVGPE